MRLVSAVAAVALILSGLSGARAEPTWRDGASGHWAALKDGERERVPVFVYFRTEWCGVCKKFDQSALASKDVVEYLKPFAKVRVNPESGKNERIIADQYGVKGYPSLWVVMPGRKPVSMPIYMEPEAFLAGMKKIVGPGAPLPDPGTKTPAVAVAVAPIGASIPTPVPIAIPKTIPRPIAILMEDQKYKQALDEIDDALELNPSKADLYLARGLCYRALKKHVDAASDFDAYARKKPDDIPVRMLLARTYLNVSMYEEAASELTALLEKKPPPEALWLLGEAKKGLGKPKEATEHYAAACKAGFAPACSAK